MQWIPGEPAQEEMTEAHAEKAGDRSINGMLEGPSAVDGEMYTLVTRCMLVGWCKSMA